MQESPKKEEIVISEQGPDPCFTFFRALVDAGSVDVPNRDLAAVLAHVLENRIERAGLLDAMANERRASGDRLLLPLSRIPEPRKGCVGINAKSLRFDRSIGRLNARTPIDFF